MRTRLRSRLEEQERTSSRANEEIAALQSELRLVRQVLDSLPVGVVVHRRDGEVWLRNHLGAGPTGDLQADALVSGAVDSLLEAGAPDGARETVELQGPPRRSVEVTVRRIGDEARVVVLQDASERQRLDALRRDFVENVNHELRTPIGALGVLVEAIAGETDPEVIRRLSGRMAGEVHRATVLIEDLLELSQVEQATDPVLVEVELVELVDAAVARVGAAAEAAGIRLETSAPSSSPVLRGDRDQLVSAIANLLDNAVKYSPAGGSVHVRVERDDPPSTAAVVVTDRGVGIPARDLERIFERFYRVDRARDRRTGGTGLGLAIVRNVAVGHGGHVSVTSVEGEGSQFTLRLPSLTSA